MKRRFTKSLLLILFPCILFSCVEEDVAVNPTAALIKITDGYAPGASAKVEVWAKQELFAGYNEIFFAVYDSVSGAPITEALITLDPQMDMHTMQHGCPVEFPESIAVDQLFPAAIMFTMPSGEIGSWTLRLHVENMGNGKNGEVEFPITVNAPSKSTVISFVDEASAKRYYMSYHFPLTPKVGVNEIEIIVFTMNEGDYIPVEDLQISMEPEMPSMDHGSPNNQNPIHTNAGHYVGKVNFTMTGEWRINLALSKDGSSFGLRYFDLLVE